MTGGGQITIEVSNFTLEKWFAKLYADLALGEYVVVSVSDTGAGMAPEVIARAFEPFFTTKETGKGSGLGLSMVHGYMRQSGGTVKIYSELGIGTTVSLYFPRGTVEGVVAQPAAKPAEIPGGSERILVVEDNPAVRKVAANILQSLGYRIAEAESAPAALSMLGKQSFDLVFSDIVMPKMNGIMLAEVLRRTYPAVAVLLTSGFSSKLTSANEIQRLGVNFVEKPYRKARLAQAVRAALGGAHAAG
jgi:CheY-like chemotaxis protein